MAISNLFKPSEPTSSDDEVIELTLDQVDFYENNPRLEPNPAHDDLKASIRFKGIENRMTIAIHPKTGRYTLIRGGKTRLTILNELWEETGEDKYYRQIFWIKSWPGEANVLASHLIENVQAPLTWVDRAIAEQRLLAELEKATPGGKFDNQQEAVQALNYQGIETNRSTLSTQKFVVEILYPAIPAACRSWNRAPVLAVNNMYNNIAKIYKAGTATSEEEGKAWFCDQLPAHNKDGIMPTHIQETMIENLALFLEVPVMAVTAQYARLIGGEALQPEMLRSTEEGVHTAPSESCKPLPKQRNRTRQTAAETKQRQARKPAYELAVSLGLEAHYRKADYGYEFEFTQSSPLSWLLSQFSEAPNTGDYEPKASELLEAILSCQDCTSHQKTAQNMMFDQIVEFLRKQRLFQEASS